MFNIILFGPPGSGKGTHAAMLIDKFNLFHLSTGDILREEIRQGTELGKKAQLLIEKGELVPDDMVISIIKQKINKNKNAKGFIFDGFPRTVEQAIALDKMLEEEALHISLMVTLEVEENELINRIVKRGESSGRADDVDENIIKNRIKIYHEKTEPVADYYRKQGKHVSVNNMKSVEHAFNELSEAIINKLNPNK